MTQDKLAGYGRIDFESAGKRRIARRKKPTLADFGLYVTISMAAFSRQDHCLVMVTDTMLSYGDEVPATDNATEKVFLLESKWFALFAGSPSPLDSLLSRVRQNLKDSPFPASDEAAQLDRIKCACREAYRAERSQQVTDKFLSIYGMSLEEFRREGYNSFGPQVFSEIARDIRDFSVGTELLVCGFDTKNFPHIFAITDPGEVIDHDREGCAAIGSGNQMAMGILSPRSINRLPWGELVYRLCEAKFSSETAAGVGRTSFCLAAFANGIMEILRPVHFEQLRQIWERQRATPIPAEALDIIHKGIVSPREPLAKGLG